MIRNEVKLIGRLTANPELKYTKETNKALCNVVLAVNSIYSNEAEYLHLVFWNKTAEKIAVTGYLKTRSYIDKENIVRNIVEVIVEQVDYLGYTKRGVDKSEPIPKLDPDHKKQEEYQMIHDALCADEDLPF